MSIFFKKLRSNQDRIVVGALSEMTQRRDGSTSFSSNSVGVVALVLKSTLRNGDPSGDSIATASPEFGQTTTRRSSANHLQVDEFISDNLLDECTINTNTHKRPAGVMRLFAEWTIGSLLAYPWLRRSSICAFLSWRAEGLARIIFPEQRLVVAGYATSLN